MLAWTGTYSRAVVGIVVGDAELTPKVLVEVGAPVEVAPVRGALTPERGGVSHRVSSKVTKRHQDRPSGGIVCHGPVREGATKRRKVDAAETRTKQIVLKRYGTSKR